MRQAAFLLAIFLIAPAVAQNADAPAPSPEYTTLWAHTTADDAALFMNTLMDDGTAGGAYLHPGTGADAVSAGTQESFRFELPLNPALTGDLALDAAGTIEATAYIGGGAFTVGRVTATASLLAGETVIGQGEEVTNNLQPGDTNEGETYNKFEWSFAPTETVIPAGVDLVWVVEGEGSWNNLYMSANENRGRSHIVLPIIGGVAGAPGVEYHDITEDAVGIDLALNGSHHYQYNWTTTESNLTMFAQGNITEGLLDITVRDGANATVYAFSGNGSLDASDILEATPGDWIIYVNATDAVGHLSIILGPVIPEETPQQDGGAGSEDDGTADDDAPEMDDSMDGGDATNTTTDGEESPGIGLIVLPLLAAIALLRRR